MRTAKSKSITHVALVYKNFAINHKISHIGLGVSALNNAKVLRKHGIKASVWPITSLDDLKTRLRTSDVTDVVLSAPWIPAVDLTALIQEYSDTEFFVNCHSNIGFLQADTKGIKHLRDYIDLEQGNLNFRVAGNSAKFNLWLREAYQCVSSYLPNMYYLDHSHRVREHYYDGGVLRIGAFGAIRPQKNVMTAAGAAIVLANEIKADVELWISVGRSVHNGLVDAVHHMIDGVPGITLREMTWSSWPQFRDVVRKMHLLIQVSYTESFNMVTADGIAEGIPSVTSAAIDWVPKNWHAHFDDATEIADVGRRLLYDRKAPHQGLVSLEQHNRQALEAWVTALHVNDCAGYNSLSNDPYLL